MNEIPHPGFDKPEEYETFTTTNVLQEYASHAGFDYVDDIEVEDPGHRWNDHDVEYAYRDGIIAGAKWQADHTPLPEDTVLFNKGVAEGKRLMMEEAVEGIVCYGSKGAYIETDFLGEYDTDVYGNPGDKVRVIVVKE